MPFYFFCVPTDFADIRSHSREQFIAADVDCLPFILDYGVDISVERFLAKRRYQRFLLHSFDFHSDDSSSVSRQEGSGCSVGGGFGHTVFGS